MWVYAKSLIITSNNETGFMWDGDLCEWVPCAVDVRQITMVRGHEHKGHSVIYLKNGTVMTLNMTPEVIYQLLISVN